MFRIKRNDLSTKPRLLSLISSLLQVKTGFHVSALEQRVTQQVRQHRTVSGVVCSHPGRSQYLRCQPISEGKGEGATEDNWLRKGSPFSQGQSQHSASYPLWKVAAFLLPIKLGVLREE